MGSEDNDSTMYLKKKVNYFYVEKAVADLRGREVELPIAMRLSFDKFSNCFV